MADETAQQEDGYFASNPPPRQLPELASRAEAFIAHHARARRRVVLVTSGGTTVPLERQTVRFIDNFSAGTRGATSAEHFVAAGYAVIFLHREFSLRPYMRHFSHARDGFLDLLEEVKVEEEKEKEEKVKEDKVKEEDKVKKEKVKEDEVKEDKVKEEKVKDEKVKEEKGGGQWVVVRRGARGEKVRTVLREYRRARDADLLLEVPFVTIGDYLHALRALARLLRPLGPDALLYLAAAVSDFFVPPERMSEHKIQSTDVRQLQQQQQQQQQQQSEQSEQSQHSQHSQQHQSQQHQSQHNHQQSSAAPNSNTPDDQEDEEFDNFDSSPRVPRSKRLIIDLDPVPKFLKSLVDGWAPQGMIVSYKLETDPSILVLKARAALDRYQHHLVIGNLLTTRKWEVVFVSPGRPDRWLRVPPPAAYAATHAGGWGDAEHRPLRADELPRDDPDAEIEGLIIPAVAELHEAHIRGARHTA